MEFFLRISWVQEFSLFLFYVHWCFACRYVCVRAPDPLGPELQAVVSWHVGAGNWTQVLWKSSQWFSQLNLLSSPELWVLVASQEIARTRRTVRRFYWQRTFSVPGSSGFVHYCNLILLHSLSILAPSSPWLCYILASSSTSQIHRFGLLAMNRNCLITFPLLLSERNNTLTVSSISELFFLT